MAEADGVLLLEDGVEAGIEDGALPLDDDRLRLSDGADDTCCCPGTNDGDEEVPAIDDCRSCGICCIGENIGEGWPPGDLQMWITSTRPEFCDCNGAQTSYAGQLDYIGGCTWRAEDVLEDACTPTGTHGIDVFVGAEEGRAVWGLSAANWWTTCDEITPDNTHNAGFAIGDDDCCGFTQLGRCSYCRGSQLAFTTDIIWSIPLSRWQCCNTNLIGVFCQEQDPVNCSHHCAERT